MSDTPVSPKTTPASAAASVAGNRACLLVGYAELLADVGVLRGLIGPREVVRLWERHLLNCAVTAESPADSSTVADIGSGAGLPGLVWAICRPDTSVTLVEPLLRRATFLAEAVERLELDNVEVVRARAEQLHGQRRFDVVTSRAVAPLDRLSAWCLPLVGVGGRMVAMKGASAAEEIQAAQAQIARLGGGPARLVEHGCGLVDPPAWTVDVERIRDEVARQPPRHPRSAARRKRVPRWG